IDPVDELVKEKSARHTVPTTVSNRSNLAGAIYYVNVPERGPKGARRVLVRYRSKGTDGDFNGEPANLILRVFDPQDRSVFVANLGTDKPGWYDTAVDLSDLPAGRYRFSVLGYHEGFVLGTEAGTPVGVRGAGSMGLVGPDDYYLYIPKGVKRWRIRLQGQLPGQPVEVYDDRGEKVVETVATCKNPYWRVWDGKQTSLEVPRPGTVWRIRHAGTGGLKLQINDVPGVLWPDVDSARANAGDCTTVAGRRLAHAWQAPFARWLASRKAGDFDMNIKGFPPIDTTHLADEQAVRLSKAVGPYATFGAGPALLEHNQVIDPESPWVGYFVDKPAALAEAEQAPTLNPDAVEGGHFRQLGYLLSASGLYTTSAFGLNPYYENPGLHNRLVAGVCQLMLRVPERQHVDLNFVHRKMTGKLASRVYRHLPEELKEPFLAGLVEQMGRDAYFDGYVSNQGMNVILGLKFVADITDDAELKRYYNQRITAFLENRFYSNNHGQVPAGYYQEVSGFDGAYNTYSAQVMIDLWRLTDDPRLNASLVKNFEFVRHLAVTMPDGTYTSARNWNTRTDSNAFRWHRHRHGGDIPGCATFLFPKRGDHKTFDEPADAREHLQKWWGKVYDKVELDGRKWWSGFSVDLLKECPPIADPLEVACHEAPGRVTENDLRPEGVELDREGGEFIRRFGKGYLTTRTGPWYAVFFSGDRGGKGKSGSGLSMLWHHKMGPLVCGDTKIKNKTADKVARQLKDKTITAERRKALEYMLVLCDAWDHTEGDKVVRVDTESADGPAEVVAGGGGDRFGIRVSASPRRGGDWTLSRTYRFGKDGGVSVDGAVAKSTFADHALYLPLVTGPAVELTCLDDNGKPMTLKVGQAATVSAWRWSLKGEDDAEPVTLSFGRPVEVVVRSDERCSSTTLRVFRVLLGDQPGRFTIK
ncbi:MAG: hypothetical protein ACOCXX_03300, partial [Planctomycetota bacterium]